ncbi:AMP-binding protein [Acaryochloris sp. IP29b_bin.137]|uniref:AMP-binding protein n=1 Tax=Acaryochloris sp. IP29b_bin.137 TaxID=2969217 RepID=UPI0026073601|nr:AMP-binding protein [Acaryochloris sp. IP29b_bin.137]
MNNSQITDAQVITAILANESSIEECIVLERTESTFVAYVVATESYSSERLSDYLESRLPSHLLPKHFVPLSRLPRNKSGTIDEAALTQIEILDTELIRCWETALTQVSGINQVAVVSQANTVQSSVLHLSDVLPKWKQAAPTEYQDIPDDTFDEYDENIDNQSSVDLQAAQSLALVNGGSLPEGNGVPKTLPEMLGQSAAKTSGERITYLNPDGSTIKQSYTELLADAECILSGLRDLDLKPQDKVIFQLERVQDIIPAFWGCILGGFIPVITGLPPSFEESNSMLEKLCGVWQLLDQPLILTDIEHVEAAQNLSKWLSTTTLHISTINQLRTHKPDQDYHQALPGDTAFFNLTSGSTGTPKCIALTHSNLISRALGTNILCGHTVEDIILNWLPFDHIGSISDWHIRCVYLGCHLVYTVKEYVLGNPLNWLELIHRYRVTHSWAPNFAYALVNEALSQGKSHYQWDLSCVKSLLTAGEAVSSKAVEEFIDNLDSYGFQKTAIQPAFGMAEMGSGITYYQPTEAHPILRHTVDKSSLKGKVKRVSQQHSHGSSFTDLGTVIPGVSIRIVDSQNNVLEEDTVGRLHVKGAAVSPGYYKNPEVNKEVFLEDKWFDTGDLAFISKGHLVVTGRAKETIIINGSNYYNHEIESAIEAIDGIEVSFTAACAVSDSDSATEKLAIFFSPATQEDVDLTDLIRTVRQTVIAKVGANPDYLIPIDKDIVPKTAIGKIQRSKLVKQYESGDFSSTLKKVDILLGNANTLPNWFYEKIWIKKTLSPLTVAHNKVARAVVFNDTSGLGDQVCQQLKEQGSQYIVVGTGEDFVKVSNHQYLINPLKPTHFDQLFVSLAQDNLPVTHLFHLWGYGEYQGDPLDIADLEQRLQVGTYTILSIIKALAASQQDTTPTRLMVVSSFLQPVVSGEKIEVEKAPVLGLLKSASQEFPWLSCAHIDLPVVDIHTEAESLLLEAQSLSSEREVAYRDDQRWVPRLRNFQWSPQEANKVPFETGAFYILTGGLGGIGMHVAKYLLENYDARLLLVGNTELPDRTKWDSVLERDQNKTAERIQTFLSLEEVSNNILYRAVDVGDLQQLQHAIDDAENYWQSPLKGVIHLAGSAPERTLAEESYESLAKTLRPKVGGTWNLHQIFKDKPDAIFLSFSSLAGFFGGAMIGAYAAANTYLDYFAYYQKQRCNVKSYCLAWAMWDSVGLSQHSQAKEVLQAKGYIPVSVQQGLNSLIAGLQHGSSNILVGLNPAKPNILRYLESPNLQMKKLKAYYTTSDTVNIQNKLEEIVVGDSFGFSSQITMQKLKEMPERENGSINLEYLQALADGKSQNQKISPRTKTEQQLANMWKAVLEAANISVNESFFELGGSSLKAAQLFAKIEKVFGVTLPLETILQAPTIEQLSHILDKKEEAVYSTLVAIQPEGKKPPFFCVPPAAMTVIQFNKLSSYMGTNYPFYGFQPLGMDGKEEPQDSVEKMAVTYIEEMRKVQPKGPYYIGGQCFGGIVAFEMGQQLLRQGEKVAFLALIDTQVPPNVTQDIWGPEAANKPKVRFVRSLRKFKKSLLSTVSSVLSFGKSQQQESLSLQEVNIQKTFACHLTARLNYIASVYPGKLTMFGSAENNPEHTAMHPECQYRWIELTKEGLDWQLIPGDHLEITMEPSVKTLARKLIACINSCAVRSNSFEG